jgi:hypothetical protein
MKSVLAGGTQLFNFLLNKTKSYSRRLLEVKGLDQDRGVWCTTILSSIFPLSDLLLNYSSTHLKSILQGAHRWTGFLWRRPLQISLYVKLLFINFSHNFLKLFIGHWKYPQIFLNPQENNPSDICCTKLQTKYYVLASGFFNWRVQAERLMQA